VLVAGRHRRAGAVIGALVGLSALWLRWPAATGATALLAAVAVVPMWVSAYRVERRRTRRRLRYVLAGFAALVVVAGAASLVLAARHATPVLDAVGDAESAAESVRDGQVAAASGDLRAAAGRLTAASEEAAGWWMQPARVVPLLGPNVEAFHRSTGAAAALTGAAAALAGQVDYEALQRPDGGIDLTRVEAFREPAREAAAAMATASTQLSDADSPWLVPQFADRLDRFEAEVDRAGDQARVALLALEDLPALLGGNGARRYVLLLGNPAESRDLGGNIGNWAELVADGGRLRVVRVGSPYELFRPGGPTATIADPSAYPPALLELGPERFPQNWGASPDLSTVARLVAELYPQAAGGAPVDGVLYADPAAFAGLLRIVGPVGVPGTDRVLGADDAERFLLQEQFALPAGDEAVTAVVRETLRRLTEERLPGPRALADALGAPAAGGHLRFHSLTDRTRVVPALGLDRSLARPAGGDLLAVVSRNANPSKIDAFLSRTVDLDVSWDPRSGRTSTTVEVTLTNSSPDSEVAAEVLRPAPGAPPGSNRTQLAVITPSRLERAWVDGRTAATGTQPEARGLRRHSLVVDLDPGETRTVRFRLAGEVAAGDVYRLAWFGQPLATADRVEMVLRRPGTTPESVRLPGRGDAVVTSRGR
jgi:hypothetical protein